MANEPRPILPQALWRTEQIRRAELLLSNLLECDLYCLMERAGAALLATLQQHWPRAERLWIVCGRGNNGGDGYVLARLALAAGLQVKVLAQGEPKAGTEAAEARRRWLEVGGVESTWPLALDTDLTPHLVVDALLGIGPERELQGDVLEWIEAINRLGVPVLSADLPSGLHADSGRRLGPVVNADVTLTFIGLKMGLLTGAAPDHVGRLQLAQLATTSEVEPEVLWATEQPSAWRIDYFQLQNLLQPRPRTAHKGVAGRVLVIGGGEGMPGSIRLAAEAALRAGAGLVKVLTHEGHHQSIVVGRPELMLTTPGSDAAEVRAQAQWASVRVLGPGLGQTSWARELWQQQLGLPGPLLIDADGLNLLAEMPAKRDNWILTPHPGEAARLLACSTARVEADRFAAVRCLQQRYGGVVVLKGAGTLIADESGCWLAQEGNPGMASGGMGDLLSGIIAALWAQGYAPITAAQLGVCVHGEAGDCAATEGERGMLASDLLPFVHRLVNPVG